MHRAEISSREEHLRKLNEELDARKDEVLKQADQVVRIQESILNSAPASEADDGSYHGVSIIPPASPKRWNLVNSSSTTLEESITRDGNSVSSSWDNTQQENAFQGNASNISRSTPRKNEGPLTPQGLAQNTSAVSSELPAAASIRLLTAQLQSLEGNLQAANAALMDKEKENDELNKSMAALKADLQKENKAKTVAEIKCDKYKRLSEENEEKSKELERELGALRKEGERLERELKKEITDSQTKEVRLNRALEEVTRVKNQMKGQSSSGKDMLEESRKKADRLAGENAKLEKQKKELITAFRKQMKLIDLLKKQKIHIEAARQLNFTEDEFSRMMENAT